jgi:hypothetical protein
MSCMHPMTPEDFAAMVKEFNACDSIEVGGRLYIAKDKVIVALAGGKLTVARMRFVGDELPFGETVQ